MARMRIDIAPIGFYRADVIIPRGLARETCQKEAQVKATTAREEANERRRARCQRQTLLQSVGTVGRGV